MNKTLYLECYSGISGDMTVGALLDLGANQEKLKELLKGLPFDGYQLKMERSKKCGIDSFSFDVILEDSHTHHHKENGHSHMHRNLYDINKILDAIKDEKIKSLSKRMFEIVATAEAKAHQLPIEEVHFHEVGAIDSIVDIVSVAFCVCDLEVDDVVVSTLYEGQGHVSCQHGILPVPVPATLNIVCDYGLTLKITDNQGEMVTPTGAAIVAALKTKETLPENVRILATGIGAGKKEFKTANILRAMLFEQKTAEEEETFKHPSDSIWMLETNIDDCSGEALSYTMEKLFEIGAKDVYYTPIYMKKNRPAYLLSVICQEEQIKKCEDIVFANTTTIGIRKCPMERTTLKREIRCVETTYGSAKVKVCEGNHGVKLYPEYESVKKLCVDSELDYQTVYHEVMECAKTAQK